MAALQISDADRIRRNKLAGLLGRYVRGETVRASPCCNGWPTPTKCRSTELFSATGAAGGLEVSTDSEPNKRSAERAKLSGRSEPNKSARGTQHTRPGESAPDAPKLPPEWRDRFLKAQELNRSLCFLTSWETNFVADLITGGTRWPSPKQAAIDRSRSPEAGAVSSQDDGAAAEDWEDAP